MQKQITTYKITYVWDALDKYVVTIERPYSEHHPQIIDAYKLIADDINKYGRLCPFDYEVNFDMNVVYHKATLQIYAKVEIIQEEVDSVKILQINEKANP